MHFIVPVDLIIYLIWKLKVLLGNTECFPPPNALNISMLESPSDSLAKQTPVTSCAGEKGHPS